MNKLTINMNCNCGSCENIILEDVYNMKLFKNFIIEVYENEDEYSKGFGEYILITCKGCDREYELYRKYRDE